MSWEGICDIILPKMEKAKRDDGDAFTVSRLESLSRNHFNELKGIPYFQDHFEGQTEENLHIWLNKINSRLKSIIVTTAEPDNVLSESEDYSRWLNKDRIKDEEWHYWSRYYQYLKRIGRPLDVLSNTEKSTFEIIERLGDPRADIPELQKGLVLGAVQSGKTANFNGVVNRAIDLGYDLIIVFSGIMDDLRTQTQRRINSDVIGLGKVDSGQQNQPVGVGCIENFSNSGIFQIESVTSEVFDFNKRAADSHLGNRKIMVCKKNHSVLANILYWIRTSIAHGQDRIDKSILILDDEADNASLNNLGHKGVEYASKINGHIRALLNLFKRRSYLGYTATPFANILQDQNAENIEKNGWEVKYRINGEIKILGFSLAPSLFPDKFIYKLNPPSSYIGPKQFFSFTSEELNDLKLPLIVTIEDHNQPAPDAGENDFNLSRSMRDAIDCFILSIALRESRNDILKDLPGYTSHHSMLIHISRLIDAQNALAENVSKYVKYLSDKINFDGLDQEDGIYKKLELQWNRFFEVEVSRIKEYLPAAYNADGLIPKKYQDISKFLPNAISNVEVKAVNSKTKDKLEYKGASKKYIAIGGNRLSRGFTLEGLTVNYFLRSTNYYDALLQMGRWFGYRPGYIDACRLFIDKDTEERYDFVNETLHELEVLIESMEAQKKSPKDFELRIKKHPGVLKITRPSILKNGNEVKFSYSASHKQSTVFNLQADNLLRSWADFRNLYSSFTWTNDIGFYRTEVNIDDLFKFLDITLAFSPAHLDTINLKRYIKLCNEHGKLMKWTIAIKRGGSKKRFKHKDLDITGTIRRGPQKEEPVSKYYNSLKGDKLEFTAAQKSKNIITSGTDESLGLDITTKKEAENKFREFKKGRFIERGESLQNAIDMANKITIPGHIFYDLRSDSEGLLLVYLIDIQEIFSPHDELLGAAKRNGIQSLFQEVPLIGYALSFPKIINDPGGEYDYVANKVAIVDDEEIKAELSEDELPDDDYSEAINLI
ncbi:Z1 domain-containing protein [Chitinophaga niastensis]|uniref:Z1 domain-containing protein n=1 Tax=Chitinophaga niastensis TaxID=536980 RepID=A0A2P8HTF5_CHINA|nr:Z1 domain-containing protein [Chitinophaga niastensis]PSL49503.1 Z1 domain-containing protein [Chitinophaga niastensis]